MSCGPSQTADNLRAQNRTGAPTRPRRKRVVADVENMIMNPLIGDARHLSWSADASTPQAGTAGGERTRVLPTHVRSVDSYRFTNVAALTKQGAPPRGEPR